jgi:uncharacterized protein
VLIDANLLIAAVNTQDPRHDAALHWLTDSLNGPRRVGLPWPSLSAFLRIATNHRAFRSPLTPDHAWSIVANWLDADVAWIPAPTPRHAQVLGALITTHRISGNLVPDAHLAALAIEHGLTIHSSDSDFARFPEVTWVDPLRP